MSTQGNDPVGTPGAPVPADEGDDASFLVHVILGLLGVLAIGLAFVIGGSSADDLEPGKSPIPWDRLLGAVGLFLVVLAGGLESPRLKKLVWQRRSVTALNVAAMMLLALSLLGLVNYVNYRHYAEWDWTRTGLYSISDESRQVARNLEKPIKVSVVWPTQSEQLEVIRRLLDHYRAESAKLVVEYLDPMVDREKFERAIATLGFEGRQPSDMVGIVVQSGYDEGGKWKVEKSKHVGETELFELGGFDPQTRSRGQKKFKGEQAVTNALLEVVSPHKSKLYFLTNHGEMDLEGMSLDGRESLDQLGSLNRVLKSRNYETATLDFSKTKSVPQDATVVVVAGPQFKIPDGEIGLLETYLKDGGSVLALAPGILKPNAPQNATGYVWRDSGLEGLCRKYNVELKNEAICGFELVGGGLAQVVESCTGRVSDTTHKITAPLANLRAPIAFYKARVVKTAQDQGASPVKPAELVKVNTAGPPASNFLALVDPLPFLEKGEGETVEPQPSAVVVAVEQALDPKPAAGAEKPKERRTRLIVVGSSAWVSNAMLESGASFNEVFFLNCVSWLTGQERFTHEAVKESEYKLDLSKSLVRVYSGLACPGMPFLAIMVGVAVWVIRRK